MEKGKNILSLIKRLVAGGAKDSLIIETVKSLRSEWEPTFPAEEIPYLIKEVKKKLREGGNGSLAEQVRDWVINEVPINVHFLSTDCPQMSTSVHNRVDKKNLSMIFSRLVKEGILERGKRYGEFRKIDNSLKKIKKGNPHSSGEDIILPLGLDKMVKLYPGNIVVVAGAPNAGKTAFLFNIAADNMGVWKVHYFNSEMGEDELTARLEKFEDVPIDNFYDEINIYERSENFADVIVPGRGNLNIVDFLEIHEEHYLVGRQIKDIHDKLDGALCFIAIQKKSGRDEGVGGLTTLEKPRLYLAMNSGVIKIVKAKNWRDPLKNPNRKELHFKLVDGYRFIPTDSWSVLE